MKRSIVALCIFITLSSLANAEMYKCEDRDGNTILTSSPQDGMTKCVLKESSGEPEPQYRAPQKAMSKEMERKVEMEKKWLKNRKEVLGDFAKDIVKKRLKDLEDDPEQYFYNKEQREKVKRPAPAQVIINR